MTILVFLQVYMLMRMQEQVASDLPFCKLYTNVVLNLAFNQL